ncbi:MAG: N-acetylmuramoyl-L-alanine amidase [Gemmatimonadaceae bacterium]|nr:N-acetylmuramoyl-L-alanine amidase [Gemmatimonadaceae bacterium]
MTRRTVGAVALALAAGIGATPPGDAIRIRGVAGDTVVALRPSSGGGLLDLVVATRLLGGTLDSLGGDRWRVGLYGATLELRMGSPFATYNGFALPLHEAPRLAEGVPHAPLQLFSEIVPRFGIGILWDRSRAELRVLTGIARRSLPQGPGDPAVPTNVATVAAGAAEAGPLTATPTVSTRPSDARVPAARGAGPAGSPARPAARPARPAPPPAAVSTAAAPVPDGLSRRYTVVVDAGHGGVDPGMQGAVVNGRRLSEARITLQVATRLRTELEALGLRVVMTRTTDTLIGLHDRGPIANAAKGDVFVSVHVNSANPRWKNAAGARGYETFFLSTARTEDEEHVAAMENEVVRFETEAPPPAGDDALAFILNDLARNEHLRESSEFAAVVQQHLGAFHPGPSRGVKQGNLSVLARAYMPAVLVEIGFGSNVDDAKWMASEQGQADAAKAIAAAALEYLQHYERRKRAGDP